MLSTDLLTRSLGEISAFSLAQDQTTRQVNAIQPAARIRFEGVHPAKGAHKSRPSDDDEDIAIAHTAGTNAIVIDKFEGR